MTRKRKMSLRDCASAREFAKRTLYFKEMNTEENKNEKYSEKTISGTL